MRHRFVHEFDDHPKRGERLTLVICFVMVAFLVACTSEDQSAGVRTTRPLSDLKLSSGNRITQAEVDKADDGRVYFRYETEHAMNSCDQLSEVRELWTTHVINLPEAAAASEIVLDPTDPTGRSRGWRYRKQDKGWTEWFSPQCAG